MEKTDHNFDVTEVWITAWIGYLLNLIVLTFKVNHILLLVYSIPPAKISEKDIGSPKVVLECLFRVGFWI